MPPLPAKEAYIHFGSSELLVCTILRMWEIKKGKEISHKGVKQENEADGGRGTNDEVTEGNRALGNSSAIMKISSVLIILTLYNVSITRASR